MWKHKFMVVTYNNMEQKVVNYQYETDTTLDALMKWEIKRTDVNEVLLNIFKIY